MRRLAGYGFSTPWLITLGLFWLYPIVFSVLAAFTDAQLLRADHWAWIGFGNFERLFADSYFLTALSNTFVFVLGTVPVTTIIALALALLVKEKFPGRDVFRAGFFLPSITAMVVIALVFTNLYQRGGYIGGLVSLLGLTPPAYGFLYDDRTALFSIMAMDVWMAVGYYMLIFLSGLQAIPDELYEAAEISGASAWQQFRSITLPMLAPTALFIIVINSIKSFQVFVEIFVMTKGKFDTATLVYFVYDKGLTTGFEFGYASAAALILFGIIAIFSAVQFFLFSRRGPIW